MSFVRSVTMDKWKESELSKMKVGGNKRAKEFFESQPDYRPNWSLQEKYNSRAAALLRDKVLAESENREWSVETSSARNYNPNFLGNGTNISRSSGNSSNSSLSAFYGGNISSQSGFNDYNQCGDRLSQNENRYQGFGNTVAAQNDSQGDLLAGAMSSLSMGWNMLSKGASTAAVYARDIGSQATAKASELGGSVTEKVREGSLLSNTNLSSLAHKATEIGSRSWSGLSSFVKSSSLQGLNFPGNKSQYEDLGTPDSALDGFTADRAANGYQGYDTRSTSDLNPEGHDSCNISFTVDDDSSFSQPAVPMKTTSKKFSRGKTRSASVKKEATPPLIDFGFDSGNVAEPATPLTAAAKARSQQTKPATKKKDWDDDAWDLLNQ